MSTPMNGLGTMYLADGGRRSYRLARIALKDPSEEDLKIGYIHLQGDHQLQDRTIQALRLQIEQLYATFSTAPTVPNGEMWTLVGDAIVQHTHATVAILENFKAQVPHVLPMVGHALARTMVNKIVGWISGTVWEQCIGGDSGVSAVQSLPWSDSICIGEEESTDAVKSQTSFGLLFDQMQGKRHR